MKIIKIIIVIYILLIVKNLFAIKMANKDNILRHFPDIYKKLNSIVSLQTAISSLSTEDIGASSLEGRLCSGIIIESNSVLTNKHCLEKDQTHKILSNIDIPFITQIFIKGNYKKIKRTADDVYSTASIINGQQIYISSIGEVSDDKIINAINNDWVLLQFDVHPGSEITHTTELVDTTKSAKLQENWSEHHERVDLFDSGKIFPVQDIVSTEEEFQKYLNKDGSTLNNNYQIVIVSVTHGEAITWKSMEVNNLNGNHVIFNKELGMLSWSEQDPLLNIVTEKSDSGSPVFICEKPVIDHLPLCKLIAIVKGSVKELSSDIEYSINIPVYKIYKSITENTLNHEDLIKMDKKSEFIVDNPVSNSSFLISFLGIDKKSDVIKPVEIIVTHDMKFSVYDALVTGFYTYTNDKGREQISKETLNVKLVRMEINGNKYTNNSNINYFNIYPSDIDIEDIKVADNPYKSYGKLVLGQKVSSFISYNRNENLIFNNRLFYSEHKSKLLDKFKSSIAKVKEKLIKYGLFSK